MLAALILALGHTLVDFYATAVTPLLPYFTRLWGLSSTSLGVLAAATSLTGSLLQPLFGFYLDQRGKSIWAALSVLWLAVTMLALGWLPSFAALFAAATVAALGSAVYHPLAAALARQVSPPNRRGLYLSLFMNIGNLGWAVAPVALTAYVSAFGRQALSWLALPGLAGAAALASLRLTLGRDEEGHAGGDSPLSAGRPEVSRQVRWRGAFFLVAATILRSWVATGIQTYLPLYLVQRGASLTASGRTLTAFILSGTLAGFLMGHLADRYSGRALYASSLLVAGAALSGFLWGPPAWRGPAVIVCGAALLGSLPLTVLLIQEMLPRHTGTGSGLIIGFAGGLGGLLVVASGFVADRLNLHAALAWLVPVLPAAAACALAVPEALCRRTAQPMSAPEAAP